VFGVGPFNGSNFPISHNILGAQIAIATCTLVGHVLAALFAERREAYEHQRMLIAELDHRVKNTLARVVAVVKHTGRKLNTEEFIRSVEGRIQSMATAHALLSQGHWDGVGLIDLLRRQFAPYATDANISFDGPDVILTPVETQALAIVIHEMVTNAVKFGALSSMDGSVSICWNIGDSELRILWLEVCGAPIVAPAQSGYGTNVIRNLIPYELGGSVELTFRHDGLRCKIKVPLKECVPPTAASRGRPRTVSAPSSPRGPVPDSE